MTDGFSGGIDLAAAVGVFFISYAWRAWGAVLEINRENVRALNTAESQAVLLRDATSRAAHAEAARDALEREAADLRQRIARREDEEQVLEAVARYLQAFEGLERECIQTRGAEEVSQRSTVIYNEVETFLVKRIGPDVAARFKVATSDVTLHGYPAGGAPAQLLRRIRGRKVMLSDLAKEIRSGRPR